MGFNGKLAPFYMKQSISIFMVNKMTYLFCVVFLDDFFEFLVFGGHRIDCILNGRQLLGLYISYATSASDTRESILSLKIRISYPQILFQTNCGK